MHLCLKYSLRLFFSFIDGLQKKPVVLFVTKNVQKVKKSSYFEFYLVTFIQVSVLKLVIYNHSRDTLASNAVCGIVFNILAFSFNEV